MKKISLILVVILLLISCLGCTEGYTNFKKNDLEDNRISSKEEEQEYTVDELEMENTDLVLIEYANISFPIEISDGYPVINCMISNNTTKNITGYKRGLLAFDQFGEPLELYWNGMDSSAPKEFYNSHTVNNIEIVHEEKRETEWTLFNLKETDEEQQYHKIKFILWVFEEITFDDGTVWENGDFDKWISNLCGKKVDLQELQEYYPYTLSIN